MEKEEKLVCQILELEYNKQMRQFIDSNVNNIYPIIYPLEWFSNKNYKKKCEILREAIENNLLIIKTKSYQSMIEGVIYSIDD